MSDQDPREPDAGPAADIASMEGRLELSAPADPETMELVHALLESLWVAHPDVLDVDRFRFETAVIEILANIVEHAYQLEPVDGERSPRRFEIGVAANADCLVATLGDNGLPMALDLSDVAMPEDDLAESGRGLALAVAALDDLHYERVGGRNQWTLLCRRAASA
ncbi:ATP-binding protein [Nocardioides ferulae]|uniref:ATP-binding protein n=1 Tax=Nocardioides ferulae TaxID=2340821 RepID=UPI00198078E4|nr:ATP-binding protein [Nocardioides ferulae]